MTDDNQDIFSEMMKFSEKKVRGITDQLGEAADLDETVESHIDELRMAMKARMRNPLSEAKVEEMVPISLTGVRARILNHLIDLYGIRDGNSKHTTLREFLEHRMDELSEVFLYSLLRHSSTYPDIFEGFMRDFKSFWLRYPAFSKAVKMTFCDNCSHVLRCWPSSAPPNTCYLVETKGWEKGVLEIKPPVPQQVEDEEDEDEEEYY